MRQLKALITDPLYLVLNAFAAAHLSDSHSLVFIDFYTKLFFTLFVLLSKLTLYLKCCSMFFFLG